MDKKVISSNPAYTQKVTPGLHLNRDHQSPSSGVHRIAPSSPNEDITQTTLALEVRPTVSFSKDSIFNPPSMTASMRPNKRELRRPKLTPFINRNDDWKYCPSEPLSPSLARPDGRKAINVTDFDIGKGRHHYYNSALRDVLYLDTSRQQSSRKGMNDDDVRGADNSAEKPHGNINTKNWIFQHTFSKHSAPHDKESLEYLIGTSHQVTKSHFYHKPGSIIVNGRYSSEYELFKRRKSKDFEHLNTQSKTSKIHYPTSESSPQVEDKYFDNNDRYRKKSRKRSSQEYSAEELESNPAYFRRLKLGLGKRYHHSVLNDHDAHMEFPRRNSPFISRLELLEGRFFSPASHAQHITSLYDSNPRLDDSLQELTLVKDSSEPSPSSSSCEKPDDLQEEPLVKFRRVVKMVLILLKATYNDREGGQRRERYLSLWASVLNGKFSNSRRAYEMYGISFDPQEFKANTEVQVSTEAKAILSLEPAQRSQQQLRQALASLRQAVEEFSEFPITMQESLARVGRYEHFEAKRVIIRQGHLAENFYFILSGTAVVIILDTDKQTGEQKARTVTFLGKGKSFGELALMYKSRRTATVRCQEDVELLAVAREDFVDIFMHVERDVEPEHVTFLRSLHVLRSWPVEVLPANNPRILVFTYVRRGIVLCKDSNTSEWIYVIKSGSCRVIKALKQAQTQQNVHKKRHPLLKKLGKDCEIRHNFTPLSVLAPISPTPPSEGRRRAIQKSRLIPGLDMPPGKVEQASMDHYCLLDAIHRSRHRLSFSGRETTPSKSTSRTSSLHSDPREGITDSTTGGSLSANTVFVDLLSLLPGDIYGLESCVFRSMGNRTTSTSLVSGGAEVIMINRKFFLDHTSEQLRKRLRREIRPLPSEETLQCQLETKISWEAYRHDTLKETLELRRKHATFPCAS